MPTAKPRVQVSLETQHYELLKRLAKLQGRSASAVLSELFVQVYPVMERVAVVLQAAQRAQESAKQGLRESTEAAERDLRPFVAQALGQLDLLVGDFKAAEVPGAEARVARAAPASDPRPVTRGSVRRTHGGKQHGESPSRRGRSSPKPLKRKATYR